MTFLRFLLLSLACWIALTSFAEEPLGGRARVWQGIPGIERTAKGRVFASWFSGGPKEPAPENEVYLSQSDDGGKTFTAPRVMAGPNDGARCYDPTLWIDPKGRLWYVFNRSNKDTAKHDVWARLCDDPEASPPVFGAEFRLGFEGPYSFRMNKPTVLSSGEWVLPVTHAAEPIRGWFAGPKQLQGVGISTDEGKTWTLHGALKAPDWALENMIVELKDGRLWLLTRSGGGFLWESHSSDKGRTWSEAKASAIANPGSRFFIRRLASGNLLLVNHYKFKGRSHLTAQLSTDDGATWNDGLLLDERSNVSYPDGVEDRDGLIWMTYDRDRNGAGEILLAKFREEDVAAGKNVSGAVTLKQVINKLDKPKLVPSGWDPALAGDEVMARLVRVSAPQVNGAHDAEFVCVGERAFIVEHDNDVQPGHGAGNRMYCVLSVVNLKSLAVEKVIPMAKSEQVFANETLPAGVCFVPRILKLNEQTLRCYFTCEDQSGKGGAQMWYRDFDLPSLSFEPGIHKARLKTAAGTFDMQPGVFHADAAALGFKKPPLAFGFFIFDSFKQFDGKTYVALNNFPGKQNALALLHEDRVTFEVIGHYNEPQSQQLSESSVNRLPDGTWMAICRNDIGNYHFTTSKDGRTWSAGKEMPFVQNGLNSKPTFDRFGGVFYLGWQEATRIQGCNRSVFNVDISRDGKAWARKYRFETPESFQYPTFHEHEGVIWLTVSQSDHKGSTDRIMFGKLEDVGKFKSQDGQTRKPLPPPPSEEAAVMKRGVKLFTDRDYVIDEMPDAVRELPFFRTSIERTDVEVTKPGTLFALTPTIRPKAASQEEALKHESFKKVEVPEAQLFPGEINRVSLYRKAVKAGERLRFAKMVLLVLADGAAVQAFIPPAPEPWSENAGEKLYNGIVLPEIWPPSHLDPNSAEPMPVPYLQHPLKVIPIDVGRQLFVDDFLIESTTLRRTFHQAEKFAGNPVFKAETKHELAASTSGEKGQGAVTYLGHGGVFYEPAEKLFKMFYTAGWRGPLAVATSPDLKQWTRPDLGLLEDNLLLAKGRAAGGDNSLWLDLASKDARLKLLTDRGEDGHFLQTSAEGRSWSEPARTGKAGDYCSIFHNPFRNVWCYSIKQGGKLGRNRWYHESRDFLQGADWSQSVFWANADRLDKPDPQIGVPAQLYSLSAVA